MKTKLTRTTEGVALVPDEPMLDELGLNADSEAEVSASGRTLIMAPAGEADFRRAVGEVNEKYTDVFRRLANS